MTAPRAPRRRINELITRLDHLRGAPSRLGGPDGHKEWQHFLIHAPGLQLLVNFNLVDDMWSRDAGPREPVARMIALARTDRWRGGADRFGPARVSARPGRIDMSMGASAMRFVDGRFHLDIQLRDRAIAAQLELEPRALPLVSNNQPLTPSRTLSWLVVPRLLARGRVQVDGREFILERAPAYHDHNWGRFLWGEDFTWEWASALPWDPACPWSLVYWRITDRRRAQARAQGLFLWRDAVHRRSFLDHELTVRSRGLRARADARAELVIPRVMGLLVRPGASDIPGRVELAARHGADRLELEFTPSDQVQLAIPSETADDELTRVHEVGGRVRVHGRVRDEAVALEGPGVFEFIRH